jgi:hypothetical protein
MHRMSEQHLFEYAVIRIVPRVEREEFLNAGVILYCAAEDFLQMRYTLDAQRLWALCSELDILTLEENLRAFERICKGGKDAGPIGELIMRERFRWLTATRSTILQTSKAHPGFCTDARETLDRLFGQLVL